MCACNFCRWKQKKFPRWSMYWSLFMFHMLSLLFSSLQDVITELSRQNAGNGIQRFQVRRDNVLEDLIREVGKKNFKCNSTSIRTWFIGEPGMDYGGLTRELWSLLAKEINFKLCSGTSPNMMINPNPVKLQVDKLIVICGGASGTGC